MIWHIHALSLQTKPIDMIPFLRQVAQKYCSEGKMEGSCFIFPNRRSIVFFQKYVAEAVSGSASGIPVMMPQMFTENDFFYKLNDVPVTDRITLLLKLYECYKDLNPKAEPLDEFIFWGDVILSDFNDTDKYLADPHQLFTNVSDFKALQDNYSYLSERQRAALERFVSHFNERSSRLTADIGSDRPDVKARFLQIWNILEPLYFSFNRALEKQGCAYEGMVYRGAVKLLGSISAADLPAKFFPGVERFVFVGLNALNECEKAVMRKMRDASVAEFCWDWSGDMIRDSRNKSSFFMADNVREFPQAYRWDEDGLGKPSFHVISVPSSVGQVKIVPDIIKDREDCAVVLPDEHLLMPLLDSIPPEIEDINVTMGYDMSSSAFYSLMSDISALQLHLRERNGEWGFYYRQVWSIFSNGIFKKVADPESLEQADRIKQDKKVFIPQSDFGSSRLMQLIFRPVIRDMKSADPVQIKEFARYQLEVISEMASKFGQSDGMIVEAEFARAYYCDVTRLSSYDLPVLPLTYIRLLDQIAGNESVPFKGEPLRGLQIMGPLETRALDFTNLVILSANEGTFPRRNVSSSFIPAELRKGFGLPTYEYQDAIWAYYFYRMVQRAENVWMLYDSRTEGLHTGEESRYISQLIYHFRLPVHRYVAGSPLGETETGPCIEKSRDDIRLIHSRNLSATSIQNYLACPAKFYYSTVRGLKAADEVVESLDTGMFGTVYHDLMWALFAGEEAMSDYGIMDRRTGVPSVVLQQKKVSREYLDSWLSRDDDIRRKVKSLILNELNAPELTGRNIVTADVIVKYVKKTIERDIEFLDNAGADAFEIIGTEKEFTAEFAGFSFKGYMDRIDSCAPGTLRVNDYKTGKVSDDDMFINDTNALKIADAVFGDDNSARPKIALQFFIYDMLLKKNGFDAQIYNSIYQTSRIFKEPVQAVPLCEDFYSLMEERLEALLAELDNPDVPFNRTGDMRTCEYCDFRKICGR